MWTAGRRTPASRLVGITSAVASYEFTLDGNGNRVQSIGSQPLKASLTAGGSTLYGYNAQKNRLLSAVSGSSLSYAYDNEGQLATVCNIGLAFDYNHRLTAVGTDAQFSYDGRGNRLLATRVGVATRYIYDPWGNLMAEANSNGITRKYIYGKGLLAVVDSSGLYCYHFDGSGNRVALTDTTQTVVNSYDYDPFGVILGQQESIPQPFKFVGRYGVMAEPNGLYYMRARYYDPSVGRFISEDPIGFAGGDVNLYSYVRSNPITLIDPFGLTQTDIDLAIAFAWSTQRDLRFPPYDKYTVTPDMPISPATGKPASAYTDPTGTYLNSSKYLPILNDRQAIDLLDTIIHESVHWSLPWDDQRQNDINGTGYPYNETRRRMTDELKKEFLERRKEYTPCQ